MGACYPRRDCHFESIYYIRLVICLLKYISLKILTDCDYIWHIITTKSTIQFAPNVKHIGFFKKNKLQRHLLKLRESFKICYINFELKTKSQK
uniref:Uncharacterized protein n=1 Tax=Parascaris univalens TaxID=6257 RepID=A0A915CDZ6_PARUN